VMKTVDLAIVVPTLNEEKYLPKLLSSIAAQSVQPKEIIIVDAYSADKTVQVVKSYQKLLPQLKVYQIKKYTISRQRNFGVKKTRAKNLLFLDADIEFRDAKALEKYLKKVRKNGSDLAAAVNLPNSKNWKDWSYFLIENSILYLRKSIFWPASTGRNLFFKRTVFTKIGGFDEQIAVCEDVEIVQRAFKAGARFDLLSQPRVYTSTRRLQKEGHIRHLAKMTRYFMLVKSLGYRNNPIEQNYEFGNF